MPFGKLQVGLHVPSTEEWLPSGHSTIQAWLVECCRDGCPSGRFSSLYRAMLELSEWPSWSPLWQMSLPISQFGRADNCRKLGGSKLLSFTDDGGHCAHWDLQCCRNVSVPRYNPVSEVHRQFLGLHGLVCALTCTVGPYIVPSKLCPINWIYHRWTPIKL